jgi:hypothetical protein
MSDYIKELEKQNDELRAKLVASENENEYIKDYSRRLDAFIYRYKLSVSYADPNGVAGDPRIDIPVYCVGDCVLILERLFAVLPIRHVCIKRRSAIPGHGELSFTMTTRFYRVHTPTRRGTNIAITDFEKMKTDLLAYLIKRRNRQDALYY